VPAKEIAGYLAWRHGAMSGAPGPDQAVRTHPYNRLDGGGHFAAWEQPQLFSEEMRAAFRSLRQPATVGRRVTCAPSPRPREVSLLGRCWHADPSHMHSTNQPATRAGHGRRA